MCPPPSYDETIKNDYSVPIPTQIKFTEEEVRNALEGYVDSKLFYRKKGLKEINIREITMNSAYHVIHFKNSFIKLI